MNINRTDQKTFEMNGKDTVALIIYVSYVRILIGIYEHNVKNLFDSYWPDSNSTAPVSVPYHTITSNGLFKIPVRYWNTDSKTFTYVPVRMYLCMDLYAFHTEKRIRYRTRYYK